MLFGGVPQEQPDQPAPVVPAHVPVTVIDPDLEEIMRDKVLQWRCAQFVKAGFTTHQARRMTLDRTVDLHFVIHRLVGRGCPHHLAFDIVS